MKWGWLIGKNRAKENSLEYPENLANLLVALTRKWDTPALIAYLADERVRLLLCKALISPVSGSDRQLARRALHILRSRGMDPERLKKQLEPAAFALGLVSACDVQIDYYNVLDVKLSATPPELRAAYRKKAFELHPDTARETKEESTDFVTLQAAYDTLMDPNSRAAFDQCRVQLGSWREQRLGENPSEGAKRRPAGKLRKTSYRIAAVVVVMVAIAWALSILYERDTMLELVQVTFSTEPESAPEMAVPGPGEVENKAPVLSEVVEDKTAPKKLASKKVAPKKPELEKPELEKPELEKPVPKKPERTPLKTAVLASPEPVEVREAVWASEPVEVKALPSAEPGKKQTPVVRESRKKETNSVATVLAKSPEKPAESPVQQAAIPPPAGNAPGITSPSTDKIQTKKPELNVSATVQTQIPAVSEDPAPPDSSIHTASVSPLPAFPDIPLPKTHKTPFIKRSQVLAFLKQYTAAYERGNAETFFSCFTANATENGKPLKVVKPDYMEIWDKLETLDYRISVKGLEQVVGSDTISMKGRFDLDWKFFDGPSGQSHGEIFMNLKLHKSVLRISRLDYRFDGQ